MGRGRDTSTLCQEGSAESRMRAQEETRPVIPTVAVTGVSALGRCCLSATRKAAGRQANAGTASARELPVCLQSQLLLNLLSVPDMLFRGLQSPPDGKLP